MTKIPSVEERIAEMPTNKCPVCDGDGCTVEHDPNDPTGQTPIQVQCDFCHAEGKITTLDCVTQTLTADRLALLTELREWSDKNKWDITRDVTVIRLSDLQAHLDELIKSTSV